MNSILTKKVEIENSNERWVERKDPSVVPRYFCWVPNTRKSKSILINETVNDRYEKTVNSSKL